MFQLIATATLLPESTIHSELSAVLAAFVGINTVMFAVVSLSVALGLLPVGVAILLRGSRLGTWPVRSLGLASVVSAGTAAVANIVEDGFGASWAGTAYFAGVVGTLLVLLVVALAVKGPRLLALVPIATVVGMVNLERAGGHIVLIAWGGLALRRRGD